MMGAPAPQLLDTSPSTMSRTSSPCSWLTAPASASMCLRLPGKLHHAVWIVMLGMWKSRSSDVQLAIC